MHRLFLQNPDKMQSLLQRQMMLILLHQHKLLAKTESNYEKLVKENTSLNKAVTDAKAKIKQAELDIETNLAGQKTNRAAIKDQKTVVGLVEKKLDEAKKEKVE